MLEFFRRTAPEQADAPSSAPPPSLEPTPRMLVLRRSQAIVAIAAAGAALVLAFVLGLAIGGSGETPAGIYVLRVVSRDADAQGRAYARQVKEQIEKLDLGEEVSVLESDGRAVVVVGSWFSNPEGRKEARALRDRLRAVRDATQATPFSDADFSLMKR